MTRRRAKVLDRNRSAADQSPRLRFRRALLLMLMSAVAPGSAQVAVGRRWIGWLGLIGWAALVLSTLGLAWRYRDDRAGLIGLVTDPSTLMYARIAIVVITLIWIVYMVDAIRLERPFALPAWRTFLIMVLNFALIGGVAGAAVYVVQVLGVQRAVVEEVFGDGQAASPLKGRYNILLLGSDGGDDRAGVRPDSLTVVSIDAKTGAAVLISLPRNLQNVPFRDDSPMAQRYPYGYNCGSECLINAVYTEAMNNSELYPDSKNPGLSATIDAVEGATNLTMSYYVSVDLAGFEDLVDAVGGVEVEVPSRLAKFGSEDAWKKDYLEPGKQRLNGEDALWFARSRVQSDDFTRMGRQKCLMAAMLNQMSPQKVVLNATDIAKSSSKLLSTNIPSAELGPFGDLALKTRDRPVTTVSLVPPAVNVQNPDWSAIHQTIADAIAGKKAPDSSQSPKSPASPGSPSNPKTPAPSQAPSQAAPNPTDQQELNRRQESANNAEDLSASC